MSQSSILFSHSDIMSGSSCNEPTCVGINGGHVEKKFACPLDNY